MQMYSGMHTARHTEFSRAPSIMQPPSSPPPLLNTNIDLDPGHGFQIVKQLSPPSFGRQSSGAINERHLRMVPHFHTGETGEVAGHGTTRACLVVFRM